MINVVICDDDLVFATSLESDLLEIAKRRLIDIDIEVYSDGSELWEHLTDRHPIELLYLDIEMREMNGIDVAKKLREKDMNTLIIYVSSYENYFIDLFEVEPFRFIKKPIDKKKLEEYFYKAYERLLKNNIFFEYKFNKISYKIPIIDIFYFVSSGREINVRYLDGEGIFYGKLNQIEAQLKDGKIPFLRIHQSYLVNFRYVKRIGFSNLVMKDGTVFQISEDRQKKIRMKYNDLLGEEFLDA